MNLFLAWMYSRDILHLCLFTVCAIFLSMGAIFPYVKWGSLCTPAVKRAHRQMLYGFLSGLFAAWIGMLELGYTKEFLAIALYLWGYSCILFRQYALIFLQDLPKMPKYPCSKYHLQHVRNVKEQKFIFVLFTAYFFLTGTLILLYLS